MRAQARAVASPVAVWIVAIVAALWFLRTARTLFIPIALAVLVSYALDPIVEWLARRRIPRVLASAVVVTAAVAAIALGAYGLRSDIGRVLDGLPQGIERAREEFLSQLGSSRKVVEATGALAGANGGSTSDAAPGTGSSLAQRAAGALFAGLGHLTVIVFLVFFLLSSGQHLKARFVEVAGSDAERRQLTAGIIDDINTQIRRYLLVLLVTAVIVGAATWAVLAAMGTRHSAMWGVLAGIFNSIPYFGPVIVSGGLFLVGMMQEGGFDAALKMGGVALVITSLEGWLLTPPLMGKAERMNALTVFIGLLVWTWLWGEWGTILAVPMLVIMKSVADHVAPLRPLGRLMAP
jgi:predicted PurR-regulated permease PerM